MVGYGDQRPYAIRMEAEESEGWQEARGSKKGHVVPVLRYIQGEALRVDTTVTLSWVQRVRQEGA